MLLGILLIFGGLALIAGYVLSPGFLWGALYSGIAGLLAPFILFFLGGVMVFLSFSEASGKKTKRKQRKLTPPPPPPPL
jgi:uncharacterized membrane protein YdjX (TVP38/TMEM64 family)